MVCFILRSNAGYLFRDYKFAMFCGTFFFFNTAAPFTFRSQGKKANSPTALKDLPPPPQQNQAAGRSAGLTLSIAPPPPPQQLAAGLRGGGGGGGQSAIPRIAIIVTFIYSPDLSAPGLRRRERRACRNCLQIFRKWLIGFIGRSPGVFLRGKLKGAGPPCLIGEPIYFGHGPSRPIVCKNSDQGPQLLRPQCLV